MVSRHGGDGSAFLSRRAASFPAAAASRRDDDARPFSLDGALLDALADALAAACLPCDALAAVFFFLPAGARRPRRAKAQRSIRQTIHPKVKHTVRASPPITRKYAIGRLLETINRP
ncbi:hypothetical protein C9J49_014585 [Halomonas sp. SL1]|nr:hypothetical protein C9J49_014585 [Halomonas sp. SL1]